MPGWHGCLIGHEHLLVKQFQPGYTLDWLHAWPQSPTCGDAVCCASPYSATSWMTVLLWGCTSSTRCARCFAVRAKEAVEATATGCRKVWEELPGCFELELKDEL
ncbi:hypothetical protein DFH08DRAFT_813465 [Mycena albidolilacea]|uniref:Uncharacterized protein n=1 Tax=Mycena albidolilacea TaxID=1033008 RepID=A0AAD7EKZ7_9AGAR|nr:hypothetical protein DFH08DRAFT_813465 [Mycena albidolilacea]